MKTKEEIQEEIQFQEKEYDRIQNMLDSSPEWPELKKTTYKEVMSRHAARRQALIWVLGNVPT